MSIERARNAYALRAQEYIDRFGLIDAAADADREFVLAWANGVQGRIIDVGCGPGHWTNYLHGANVDIEGIDPVPEFIDHARRQYPELRFRTGSAGDLEVDDGTLGGILSWYSLIHTEPDQINGMLTEFARCLHPTGSILIGFFEGPKLEPFDHAVTTAYRWPIDEFSNAVTKAGFTITDTRTRTDPGVRPQATIVAHRSQ